jgi:hypothetical protein
VLRRILIHNKLTNSLRYPWGPILNRLHSGQVSENMALLKDLILQDETKMSPIQRRTLFGIIRFIASVYRNSYEFDHFDYLLYQYKALRLWQAITSGNDFEVLSDPQSSQRRLLLELPSILSNSSGIEEFRLDLTYNIADEIVDYLESDKFQDFIKKIVN